MVTLQSMYGELADWNLKLTFLVVLASSGDNMGGDSIATLSI